MPETAVIQGTSYRLSCLGPVSLTAPDGSVRRFRTRKQMGLLLVLARSAGRPRGREQLVELLWSGDDARAARHSLAQSISLINKVFGVDAIRFAGKDQVCLREGLVRLDVDEFERAVEEGRHAEARALWRGQLLEGLWIQRVPAFEAWLEAERQRLARLYRDVLHAAMAAERTAGLWTAMRHTADALLELDPLDETAMLGYLEALTLGGDRTSALRRYGEFEARLREELDAEAGPPLKAWIKRHKKGADTPVPAAPPVPRVAETQTLPAARPVYGREEEFKFLWDAWSAAQQGRGSFIILEGPAGIGKSALAGKLANQAHVMGGAVCFVRCWRTEKSVPFAPITALLRQLMQLPGFVALNEVWIGELSRLVPELRERYPHAPAPMAIDDSARHRICDGTLLAAACVADEQPLMIVMDDIHSADEATLATLHYFGRQTRSYPVVLICTSRQEANRSDLERTFFDTARALKIAEFLELGGLKPDQSAKLLRLILAQRGQDVPDWTYAALHVRARGNPLALIEAALGLPQRESTGGDGWVDVLRTHLGTEAESVERSAQERLNSLSPAARRVATVLAVVGRPVSTYMVEASSNLPASEVMSGILQLDQAHLIRRSALQLSLAHDRYQAAIQESLEPSESRDIHRLSAAYLAKTAAEDPASHCEVARHLELAGLYDSARDQALKAASFAASIGAWKEQSTALALAHRVSPTIDVDVALTLSRCLLRLRDTNGVARVCTDLRKQHVPLGPEQTAELEYLEIAQAHHAGRDVLEDTGVKLAALLYASDQEFTDRPYAYLQLMRVLDRAGHHLEARRAARRLRRYLKRLDPSQASAFANYSAGWVAGKYYSAARANILIRRAMQYAQESRLLPLEQLCREALSVLLNFVARYDESIRENGIARALAQRLLDPLAEATSLNNMAVAEMNLGRWEDAERHYCQAIELAVDHPYWPYGAFPAQNLGILYLILSRYELAESSFKRAYEHSRAAGLWAIQLVAAGGLGLCSSRRRDFAELRRWAEIVRSMAGGREILLVDAATVEGTLAWDLAVNEGQPQAALGRLRSAGRRLRAGDVDHSLSMYLEEILLGEYLSGELDTKKREDLLTKAREWNPGLKEKYGTILALNTPATT